MKRAILVSQVLLLICAVVLWWRSANRTEGWWSLKSNPKRMVVWTGGNLQILNHEDLSSNSDPDDWEFISDRGTTIGVSSAFDDYMTDIVFFQFTVITPADNHAKARRRLSVVVPFWSLTTVLAAPLVVWGFRRFLIGKRTRRRMKSGLCVACGYRLGAELAACPECGRPVASLAN